MEIQMIVGIIWTHFLGDFILQTRQMANSKSHSNYWLGVHSLIYCLPFIWVSIPYAIVNGIFHFLIDGITSKFTTKFWLEGREKLFFTVIGFDQAIHMTCLLCIYRIAEGALV